MNRQLDSLRTTAESIRIRKVSISSNKLYKIRPQKQSQALHSSLPPENKCLKVPVTARNCESPLDLDNPDDDIYEIKPYVYAEEDSVLCKLNDLLSPTKKTSPVKALNTERPSTSHKVNIQKITLRKFPQKRIEVVKTKKN